ncbi:SRPBCC family protein [Pseudogemmobacter humi]|uniref:Carbon monoxide dehydrogenase subunit G (CoxG) n=1 Tax=Pseudogemmobacter humi TaxID=2483812 RepID=A0A3P5WTN0_9RHOB|nr:SRPBCC family protein [Pseudogemmobacter humi]VDC24978.1 Carbon monoxide dehydrogenase subunit G (CoxG) [Pseudogemmobacter humi]
MKLQQEFVLARPRERVWAFFGDVPAVARCLPGAEYTGPSGDNSHTGRMSMKVGPFQASFEGEAEVLYDAAAHKVSMSGKGVDKKGASRGKMVMDCLISDEGGSTRVAVDADVQLSGAIAQFGRTGIIQEIAGVLIADFVRNVEAALPDAAAPATGAAAAPASAAAAPRPVSGTRILWLTLKNMISKLFRRTA